MCVSSRPTLHLTVGLPGVGKTTLARELEQANGALRLTPDEWMAPLFGLRWADFGGMRDVLEGRLDEPGRPIDFGVDLDAGQAGGHGLERLVESARDLECVHAGELL